MNERLLERLASILPADGQGTWIRDSDGATFPLAAPREDEQWIEVMRLAAAERLAVQPIGRGSKLSWCRPAAELDLVLSTTRCTGIVAHEPDDGTLTARAGTAMSELRAAVGEGGHHLSPDVPRPDGATLGGVLAAGQSGIDRLRYGPVRDQVLGMRVLLADGTITTSGGRLVKNVTGYDLPRLYCGSHGTLCVILEASVRLHPRPPESAVGMVRLENRGEALDLARRVHDLPVRLTGLCAHDLDRSHAGRPWTLLFLLGARPDVLQWEIDRILETAPEARISRGPDAEAIVSTVRDLELSTDRWPTLSFTCRPSELEANLVQLGLDAGKCGLAPRLLTHPALAHTLVWLDAEGPGRPAPDPARLLDLNEWMSHLPVRRQWLDPPPSLVSEVDPLGIPTAGVAIMRRLRQAFDPDGRLSRGRFHVGL